MAGAKRGAAAVVAGVAVVWAFAAQADDDPHRNIACVAPKIGVTVEQFRACFLPVQPAPTHSPSGAEQRANKALLLPCLQRANPALGNKALDEAMDACRPEGANGG